LPKSARFEQSAQELEHLGERPQRHAWRLALQLLLVGGLAASIGPTRASELGDRSPDPLEVHQSGANDDPHGHSDERNRHYLEKDRREH